jgi:hypothetical protein
MFHLQASPESKELQKSYPSLNIVRINYGTVNNWLHCEFLELISTTQQFSTRLTWQKTEVLSATNKHQLVQEYGSGEAAILFTENLRPFNYLTSHWYDLLLVSCQSWRHACFQPPHAVFQAILQSPVTCCAMPWCILAETYTCTLCVLPRGWHSCETLVLCPRSEQASWTVGMTTLEKTHVLHLGKQAQASKPTVT